MKKNKEKMEQIGNVVLNLNYYNGKDSYSEGEGENQLLEIVKSHREDEYDKVIEGTRTWSVMYHLSHIRENIVTWLPMNGTESVLEIGSGCGAVTGMLSHLADHVTCIDLSKKRSQINAYRHLECDNIEIIVGNFKEIEPELDEKYDYVTLIGVLEYAGVYIGGPDPFLAMIKTAASHLKENGKLFIAIENKYGLKYFAGCKEDHSGKYYDGIEGYSDPDGARTFGRRQLKEMLKEAGMKSRFYYPYPDYKLPHTIYSDANLPKPGELHDNIRNFDADRIISFDEGKVFDSLIEDRMFPDFSNSFAIVAAKDGADCAQEEVPVFARFSTDRAGQFRTVTQITLSNDGRRHVYKEAVNIKANRHIQDFSDHFEELKKQYAQTKLSPNGCEFLEGEEKKPQFIGVSGKARNRVELKYVSGITLEKYLDRLNHNKQFGHMSAIIKEFASLVMQTCGKGNFRMSEEFKKIFGDVMITENYKANANCNYDLIFSNIVLNEEKPEEGDWTVLDYEWMFPFDIPAKFILYRALFYYEQGRKETGFFHYLKEQGKNIYSEYGIDHADCEIFREMEHRFQMYIIGGRASMEVLQAIMPTNALRMDAVLRESVYLRNLNMPKVYFSCGDGFSPENELNLIARVSGDNVVTLEVPITNNIVSLRIDPTDYPCFLHVEEIRLQMQKGMDQSLECYVTNGYTASENTFIYDTDDAQIILDIPRNGKRLIIRYQVKMMPKSFYEDLKDVLKEKCLEEDKKPTIVDKALNKMHISGKEILPEGYRYNQKKKGDR